MRCRRCHFENQATAKFCQECAAPLVPVCSACGGDLPPSANFCPNCAQPVHRSLANGGQESSRAQREEVPSPPGSEGERRQATVLVADISGYTDLCARFDAEQVQDLVGRFYDVTDRIIAEYGGHVIDHAGDATLGVFGAPIAHGNDSERAARAALDLHTQAKTLGDPGGRPLMLHVGISSGEVVAATIGGGVKQRYQITGEAVNMAARLSSVAQPGETIISEAVWNSVSRVLHAEPLGEMHIKGFAKPVAPWKLAGEGRGRTDRAPFVGRQTELRQLQGVLDAVEETGKGSAVLLRGGPGIGKTRLVEELRRRAQGRSFACHIGQVLDFGVGKGQDAIPTILRTLLNDNASVEHDDARDAIERAVASGLVAADQRMLINDLLELPQSPELQTVFESMDQATRTRRSGELMISILQRSALLQPRLVIVEDIHWASPDLLRYLALIARSTGKARIALLMTSRPDGDPLDRNWRASTHGSPLATIDLGPLPDDDARLMAIGLTEKTGRLAECIERAEGNPLFLEQLLRNAQESDSSNLPGSIQSLVLARMDRLEPRDKAALQVASVFGKRFTIEALRCLTDDIQYSCDALMTEDLVRPEGGEFVFAHALIQEGVYASLLNARKRELHRRAADWFGEGEPVLRAEHLDRAADESAAAAYLSAAIDQARMFRQEAALSLVERGGKLARDDAVRCHLWLVRGDLLRDLGRSADSLEAFQQALAFAKDKDQRYQSLMGIVAAHRVTSDISSALHALDQAEQIADRMESSLRRGQIHYVRGNLYFAAGRVDDCQKEHEIALRYAQQAGDVESEVQALSGLGDAQYAKGRIRAALGFFRRCVELCERAGLAKTEIPNRCMMGHCLYYMDGHEAGMVEVMRSIEQARELGQAHVEIFARESHGLLSVASGDYDAAETAVADGILLAREAGARRYLSAMLYCLGMVEADKGARKVARRHLNEAFDLAEQTGVGFIGPAILSGIAMASDTYPQAREALGKGEALLGEHCPSHSQLSFYRNAIDISLRHRDWSEVLRYAAGLEKYVSGDPLPWSTLIIERARGLVSASTGNHSNALRCDLQRIRSGLERMGLRSSLADIDVAIRQCESDANLTP